MSRPRRTLACESRTLHGVGLHSGHDVSLRLCPAPPGAGFVFVDAVGGQEIAACPQNVVDTSRCTILGQNGVQVQTVEHVLAALASLGVDDAYLHTSGGEMPAADGSALLFMEAIREAGLREQEDGCQVLPFVLETPVFVQGTDGASIVALPSDMFRVTVVLDYPSYAYLGTSAATFTGDADAFGSQIAPARTYGFLTELAWLRARGLALGASMDNALALGETDYETAPRFSNELARHKLLDVLGDIALMSRPVQAHLMAFKPGHTLNVALARLLSV